MSDRERQDTLAALALRRETQAAGFTLLEASLVILILSLVVVGLLAGRDLLDKAAVRKQLTQLERIEAGVQNFRTKYACMPGDCIDPTIISGYTYAGNGDGFLAATWNDDENKGFWIHLNASNMIVDPLIAHGVLSGMKVPQMALRPEGRINAYGSQTYAQNMLELATTGVSGALRQVEIQSIDRKIDDGAAGTGNVRSSGYGSGSTTVYASAPTFPLSTSNKNGATQCITSGNYSGTATIGQCNMIYLLGNY